ncbi:restriction endonuclease subunit S [Haemophilus haemolyticus]|uniref:restriction endonuclease subunit S n=1 Tax=Haemophilus haemolyticus TaxID=726 RepID=UPI001864366F|nr:restriction endonuclease subunit S [Haemophilus haemolyticus]
MNRYERYKESGIPWLGEVPAHWSIVGISKLFMLKAGGDLQPDFFSREKDDEHCYPIYTNANDEHAVYGYTSKKRFNADSITVSGRGDIGFAVYRDHDFDAIIRLLVLSPLKKLDCKYYTYSINALLDFKFESSAVAQLSTVQLAQYKLLLPDYKEQTAIAHYLDTKLGDIDALIGKQQTLLEKLAEQRTAVITHAVTKGLNPAAPMKNSGVEWLGDVPAHWDIVGISKLFMLKAGGDLQPDFFSREKDDEHCYPIYTNANDEHAVYGYTSKKRFNADSITVSGRGDIGFAVYRDHDFDAIIRLLVLSPLKKLDCKYYTYSINALLDFNFESSAVAQLSTVQLAQYKLLLPSYEEQTAIANYLDQETAKIDRLCETVNQTIGRLKEYRTALITQAVTGKIKVTN